MTGFAKPKWHANPAVFCQGKDRFDTQAQAKTIADRMVRRKDMNCSAYRCMQCGAWRVGSQAIQAHKHLKHARKARREQLTQEVDE